MTKQMLVLKDSALEEILDFLDKAELAGRKIPSVIGPQIDNDNHPIDLATHNVAYEARQLKELFLKLYY